MNETFQSFLKLYMIALQYYLAEPEEAVLQQAYEMGRKALSEGIGLLEVMSVHQEALISALARITAPDEDLRVAKGANEFLKECLAPFEMSLRGYQETNTKLFHLNETLEQKVTERTEALRRLNEELEQRVAERTAQLAKMNKELEEANMRLKDLDRLKSMFIASMSHELRTPLNSIIGFTGIILQGMAGEISDEQRKQLTMVKNSANHLLALINDIIDLSKIEAGKVEPFIEAFDITDLASDVKDSFDVTAIGGE
jgi:signal transduction histidine kinase